MFATKHAGLSRDNGLALELQAASAGCALACRYSSSDEFEAALIRERRAAGIYGPRRHRRRLVTVCGVAAAVAVLILAVL
jgi:hypothetical protein